MATFTINKSASIAALLEEAYKLEPRHHDISNLDTDGYGEWTAGTYVVRMQYSYEPLDTSKGLGISSTTSELSMYTTLAQIFQEIYGVCKDDPRHCIVANPQHSICEVHVKTPSFPEGVTSTVFIEQVEMDLDAKIIRVLLGT